MTINKNNYEAFFLDYHEKNLSPELVAELLLFLEQHPELQKEFDAFTAISLSNDATIVFEEKEKLKRRIITPENFNEFAVANLEGDLTSEEKNQYKKFIISNPVYKKEDRLFAQTKLRSDLSIKFPGKQILKKGKARIISLNAFYIAAAACVLLMLGMFFSKQQTNSDLPQTAEKVIEKKVKPESEKTSAPDSPDEYPISKSEISPPQSPIANLENLRNNSTTTAKSPNVGFRALSKHKPQQSPPSEDLGGFPIPLIETKTAFIPEESFQFRLKSLQTFPVYILDENYAMAEPVQATPVVVFENFKRDAIKKLEKSEQDNDENWFPENAFNAKKKIRLIDVVASAVNKISGKKVKLQPEYNDKGEMVSYDFTAGAFSFKKDFSK